jgi:hypothetical protein
VRVNLACDAIISSIITSYGAHNTHLAFLCTPTDAYLISKEARFFYFYFIFIYDTHVAFLCTPTDAYLMSKEAR